MATACARTDGVSRRGLTAPHSARIPLFPVRGGAMLCGGKRTSAVRSFPRRRESGLCLRNEIPASAGMSALKAVPALVRGAHEQESNLRTEHFEAVIWRDLVIAGGATST